MKILGFEKMSLVDFDGLVSATLFTGGCNFKCGFCHNSPLVSSYKDLPEIPQDGILAYLKKRQGILDGVCVSGGEPTLNNDLPEFIEKIKNLGYKVKLDTNGTNPDMVKQLFNDGLVDYFAMDIKNDKKTYAKIIGFDAFDTAKVEKTVEFFLTAPVKYEFRTTLVNEFHTKENMINIGKWIKGADKYFLQKFKENENCIEQGFSPVEEEKAKEFIEILTPYIPTIKLRGY
ncbi:MAG: anaerobic ribonucleoside-triphosphate reductase activating protein [Clostridia bacterium]|nr:anaerobic ribonucleoside-triphosphate reductase activating protein [Clostridia bacterium]